MKILDWHVTDIKRDSFTLKFDVPDGESDTVRLALNKFIQSIKEFSD